MNDLGTVLPEFEVQAKPLPPWWLVLLVAIIIGYVIYKL